MTQSTANSVSHTPGPWRVVARDGKLDIFEATFWLAEIPWDASDPRVQADARLIAEAPAMLGLLEEFVGLVRGANPIKTEAAALIARVEGHGIDRQS